MRRTCSISKMCIHSPGPLGLRVADRTRAAAPCCTTTLSARSFRRKRRGRTLVAFDVVRAVALGPDDHRQRALVVHRHTAARAVPCRQRSGDVKLTPQSTESDCKSRLSDGGREEGKRAPKHVGSRPPERSALAKRRRYTQAGPRVPDCPLAASRLCSVEESRATIETGPFCSAIGSAVSSTSTASSARPFCCASTPARALSG